ncbi:MAG: NAD-dependent epimerase/dehydratase family protein [Pseudomonadota bacterium]
MSGHVLVAGASGLVGTAACLSFARAGWQVTALSRSFPDLCDHPSIAHQSLDLQNADACRAASRSLGNVTHVIYTAVYELPGLMPGWSDPHQIKTNGQMLQNLLEPLLTQAQIQHVTILQGTKAYGAAVQPMRIPARESQARVDHPNFYWLHEDFVRAAAERFGFSFTILRPQLIVGPNHGVAMNLPPVIGLYAALRQAEGKAFSFPGGADWVWEAVDVRLVADACLWAATSHAAAGETFNLTNGEVFSWRDLWPAMAQALDVELGPDEPLSVAQYLSERSSEWDSIVAGHGLRPLSLQQIAGESHHYADLCFAWGADQPPAPALVSTVKIKQAGFHQTCNTEESFCHWMADLRNRRIIP